MKLKRAKPTFKRTPQAPKQANKRGAIVLFLLLAVAIAAIYITHWPHEVSNQPISLEGTGAPPEVDAIVNHRPLPARVIPPPSITPLNADQFAGVPKEPDEAYHLAVPRMDKKVGVPRR